MGGARPHMRPTVAIGKNSHPRSQRFTLSRAFWRAVSDDSPLFLVTGASTDRQKTERAFAAELLAPAAGITAALESDVSDILPEDLEQVADHFDVSTIVVQRQIENQILAGI